MTKDQRMDQVELHDEENDIVEAATHDPKNAEAQSVDSVDKAGDATGTAKKRKGDSTKQDPMPKTKAGMINAAYVKMNGMKKEDLAMMMSKLMSEEIDAEDEEVVAENATFEYEADFSSDLNALVQSEATLSEEFKEKAEVIFEAAIKSKLSEEIDRLEARYNEELSEEISSTKEELVEKVDSYLNYVVEKWMDDNRVAIQSGLRAEIAEKFMGGLKDLFVESYIEIPESKVDLVDDWPNQLKSLSLNSIKQLLMLSPWPKSLKFISVMLSSVNLLKTSPQPKLKNSSPWLKTLILKTLILLLRKFKPSRNHILPRKFLMLLKKSLKTKTAMPQLSPLALWLST